MSEALPGHDFADWQVAFASEPGGVVDGQLVSDPTFPDLPSFNEVCEATEGCEREGVAWDACKSFFVSGSAAQKMVYLPNSAPQEVVDAYTAAFNAIKNRDDFAEISKATLGIYPQATGEAAKKANAEATSITPEAGEYVVAAGAGVLFGTIGAAPAGGSLRMSSYTTPTSSTASGW